MGSEADLADDDQVSATHPQYDERVGEWARMRDTERGASAVVTGGERYLPMPDGFRVQEDGGARLYASYVARAQFPEIVSPTVVGMVGTVCRIEPDVQLPPAMEYLRESVDGKRTTLTNLYRKCVEEVVTVGGRVLLAEAPAGGGQPYLVGYPTEALINWAEDRSMFVLNETRLVRDKFRWRQEPSWRVLSLDNDGYAQELYDSERNPVLPDGTAVESGTLMPVLGRGGRPLDEIPLVRLGCRDLDLEPDNPPLLGVASAAIAIYQLNADYRHQLFWSGQETLFGVGMAQNSRPTAIGAGIAVWAENPEAKLQYVGPSCKGIEAHAKAISDERAVAAALGARMFDVQQKAGVESGDALRIRKGGGVATLVTVAQTVGEGLETALRHVARMLGEDPLQVFVRPSLSFIDATLQPKDVMALVQGWQGGAYSYETLYANLQRGEIATYERSAADERELIDGESPADPGGGPIGGRATLKPDFDEPGGDGPPGADSAAPPVKQAGENEEPTDEELAEAFDPDLLS